MSLSRYLFPVFICYFIINDIKAQLTTQIQTFSNQLESLMCDGLAVGGNKCQGYPYGIQDFIDTFSTHFDNSNEDASTLAQTIIDRLNTKLHLRASFLTNLSSMIRSECYYQLRDDTGSESIIDFDQLYFSGNDKRAANLPNNMEYSDVYGDTISFTASTYKIPNGVDHENDNVQEDAQLSQLLDSTMVQLYNDHCIDEEGSREYCNMYFGTINGVFRQFPGVENSITNNKYNDYDPRFRPWYVSAASGSKDVVILLDVSGSMRDNGRIGLAKEAVLSVLNTLGSSSFVNVVAFSDELKRTCFENKLVPATSRNIAELETFVSNLEAGGLTDFTIAFDAAFDILSTGTSCETSIIFLTDGIADDVSQLIESRNTIDINAVIFSFTLGGEADTSVPKKVAEMTGGIYTHINDKDANLITAMSSYYLYYAYGGLEQSSEEESIIITSPYIDFDTSVIMVTMAMPVYFNNTYFVGVVGTDIPLRFLSDAIGDITIGRKSYSFVMNEKSELLLHPLIPDAFELFNNDIGYKPIFVNSVEPQEFNSSGTGPMMLARKTGQSVVQATVRQPAGNVQYNGYIYENAHLLYFYGPVGPSSLSIAIVIYSETNVDAPNVPSFGLKSSPPDDCNETITENNIAIELDECLAPFNLYHRIDLAVACNSSWVTESNILNGSDPSNSNLPFNAFYEGKLYSPDYPIYFLQSGLYEHQYDALNIDPTCENLDELHKLSNRLGGTNVRKLPYGGFRQEISSNILNSIYTLTSIHEFWKPSFLANNSLFVSMWFGHYQGLHISYPAKQFSSTYNNQIRPWYQRAISYPQLSCWTTPYKHATTKKLVTGASTVVYAPGSNYAFGVLGFNYEYSAFVSYWKSVMSSVCNQVNSPKQYCYLIDSSAFLLYYDGMENDVEDSDISRKFFGDREPTLMESLLNRQFFTTETNVNFQDDTTDVSYIVDQSVFNNGNFDTTQTTFDGNSGTYTVHDVFATNLFVIYVDSYHIYNTYPINCPDNSKCEHVVSPGCIKMTNGECKSATTDVCIKPDTTIFTESTIQCSIINELGYCVLKSESESDMCASNFIEDNKQCQGDTKGEKDNTAMIIGVVVAGVVVIACILIIMYVWKKKNQNNEGSTVQMADGPGSGNYNNYY
eukprot:501158_1